PARRPLGQALPALPQVQPPDRAGPPRGDQGSRPGVRIPDAVELLALSLLRADLLARHPRQPDARDAEPPCGQPAAAGRLRRPHPEQRSFRGQDRTTSRGLRAPEEIPPGIIAAPAGPRDPP